MDRAERRCGLPRDTGFIKRRVAREPDAESPDRFRHELAHDGDDDGRVEATAEKGAQWHVTHQPSLNRGRDQLAHPAHRHGANRLGLPLRGRVRKGQLPIAARVFAAVPIEHGEGAWFDLQNVFVERPRMRHVAVEKVIRHRGVIDLHLEIRMRQQGLHLGGEDHPASLALVKQGLLAGAIAREQQASAALVPNRQREHAVKAIDGAVAQFLVQVDDHFGVGVGLELVAVRHQLFAQVLEVVNLTVEDRLDQAVLVANRLVGSSTKVDNAEAAKAQAGAPAWRHVGRGMVGSAVPDGIGHHAQRARRDLALAFESQFATDAAHDQ